MDDRENTVARTQNNNLVKIIKTSLLISFVSLCIGCCLNEQDKTYCEVCGELTRHIETEDSAKCLKCFKTNSILVDLNTVSKKDKAESKELIDILLKGNMLPDLNISFPEYKGAAVTELNGNIPEFTIAEKEQVTTFEEYSPLDKLGRATKAYALLGKETMPTEERGEIGMIKPSGWHTVKYPDVIEDLYLYNRCHLIAFCLSSENANECNLITGTRYMNVEGMLPYELAVTRYIEETDNHVLYRATPVYEGENLVAKGVQLEAYSIEDNGEGISFNIFCHNVQPGIAIDYTTGESERK